MTRDLDRLIQSIPMKRRRHWEVSDHQIRVSIGSSGRRQDVRIRLAGDEIVFWSTVLSSGQIPRGRKRMAKLAVAVWERNANVQLVAFGFDEVSRLVGWIQHPGEHLDPEEMELYVNALAVECDRFEYLLTGADRS